MRYKQSTFDNRSVLVELSPGIWATEFVCDSPEQARRITAALVVADTAERYRLKQTTAHELDAAIDAWREV